MQKKYSITNQSKKCTNCKETLERSCLNPCCPSNLSNGIINTLVKTTGKAIFQSMSGFYVPLTYCVNCGSTRNEYKTYKLYVWNMDTTESSFDSFVQTHTQLRKGDIILCRLRGQNGELRYGLLTYKRGVEQGPELKYNSIDKIVHELFPTKDLYEDTPEVNSNRCSR